MALATASTKTNFNLSISNSSTPGFMLVKSAFLANFDVLTPAAFLSQILSHN